MLSGRFTSQFGHNCHQLSTVMGRVRELVRTVRHPYRPELHYMRGPGPEARAAHRTEMQCTHAAVPPWRPSYFFYAR